MAPIRSLTRSMTMPVADLQSTAPRVLSPSLAGPRRETAATYNITVRATSTDSSSTTQVYTISLGDVDEFDVGSVSDTNATTNAVNENAAIGTTVGITASASDADATTNGITYSLVSDDGGRFAINSSTGVVTVAGAINRETDGPTRSITVRATSADGSFTDQLTQSRSTMWMNSMSAQSAIPTRLPTQSTKTQRSGQRLALRPQPPMLTQQPTVSLTHSQMTTVVGSRSTAALVS